MRRVRTPIIWQAAVCVHVHACVHAHSVLGHAVRSGRRQLMHWDAALPLACWGCYMLCAVEAGDAHACSALLCSLRCAALRCTSAHFVGRTARAGASGVSVTFAEDADRNLVKDVLKRTGVALRQRLVPQPAVDAWQAKVEKHESNVWSILAEERDEADLRKAEMEANKVRAWPRMAAHAWALIVPHGRCAIWYGAGEVWEVWEVWEV